MMPESLDPPMFMRPPVRSRRGAIAPLAAILIVFLLGMVAFSVDMGWIVLSQAELQNAADSAALAGANPLMDGFISYNLPALSSQKKQAALDAALANARTAAKKFAAFNGAGGVASLSLRDSDIEFGYTDASGNYTPQPTYTGYPNTIRVVLRRDAQANNSLRLYFAPVIGMPTINLTANAGSTLYAATYDSFKTVGPVSSIPSLPLAFDINHWNNFLKTGQDADGKTSVDWNGNPVLQVYPSIKYKGNFGLLSLDDAHAGSSEIRDWINNGMPKSATETLIKNKLIPLSQHDPNTWDWMGNNGFKDSVVQDINSYLGKTFILPLFKPYNDGTTGSYEAGIGKGSSYNFNIVQFVGVKIMPAGHGEVIIQPSAINEPMAVFMGAPVPVSDPTPGTPALPTTFTSPKLTR